MAAPVFIDGTQELGNEYLQACNLILAGIGKLHAIDGKRANAIGVGDSAVTMMTVLGAADTTQAQALSDRVAAFLSAWADSGNTEIGKLRDLVSGTYKGTGPA